MPLTKKQFRQDCLASLKNVSKHHEFYANAKLNLTLIKKFKKFKNRRVLLYAPLGLEANILKTTRFLRKSCRVYLPFMQSESFKMVPFRLPLKANKFGILEAGDSLQIIKNIDIAIVPAVGVDGNFQRVGFGKGMYDRFFAKLQKKPYTIFTQKKLCYTKKIVTDSYDVSCDELVAANKVLKNVKRDTNRRSNRHS